MLIETSDSHVNSQPREVCRNLEQVGQCDEHEERHADRQQEIADALAPGEIGVRLVQAADAHHVVQDDTAGEAGEEVGLVLLLLEKEGDVEKLGDGSRYNDEADLHQREDIEDDAVGDAQGWTVHQRCRIDGRRLRWRRGLLRH